MIKQIQKKQTPSGSVNILLVGNNPIELSVMLSTISKFQGKNVMTEIAFDFTSIAQRLISFKPNFILIDDNIGMENLTQTVSQLSSNRKTKDVPITLLKNSNYTGSIVSNEIMDYLLKQNFTSEALFKTFGNSLKFRRTKQDIADAYKKRRRQLVTLIN